MSDLPFPLKYRDLPSEAVAASVVAEGSGVALKAAWIRLQGRPPSPAATRLVCDAYAAGKVSADAASILLSVLPDESGYETACEILRTHGGREAGLAMVRVRGAKALPDLVGVLRSAFDRAVQNGAAEGLGEIGSAEACEAILDAVEAGQLATKTAATLLCGKPILDSRLAALLNAGQFQVVSLGTQLAASRAEQETTQPSLDLIAAVQRVLTDPNVTMRRSDHRALTGWLRRVQAP